MRSIIAALAAVALMSLAILGVTSSPHRVLGQEASPSPGELAPEGISFQFIAYGLLPQDMEPQEGFSMFRLTFTAGAGFPIENTDPTTALVYVEQGALTLTANTEITVLQRA